MFGGRLSIGRDGTILMYMTIVGAFHFNSYRLDPYAALLLSTELYIFLPCSPVYLVGVYFIQEYSGPFLFFH